MIIPLIQSKRMQRVLILLVLFAALGSIFTTAGAYSADTGTTGKPVVYVIPVKQSIETGLESFLARAFEAAAEAKADHIILDINTFGGRVDSAEGIGELIRQSKIPTVAFVNGKAVSAGAYIALNANRIVMDPGSTIGAASVVDVTGNEVANPKIVSHWVSAMQTAAELRGRNPQIAMGMADKTIEVDMPEIGRKDGKDQIVSLTAKEAVLVGYAEGTATDLNGVLEIIGMKDAQLVEFTPSVAERLARFLTNPVVSTILLLIGIAGVAIELFVPGFGVPGIVGVAGFSLYFFGHFIAGFAGVEHMILFIAGIILLVIEVFAPSFGILGILGIVSIFSGVVLAAYDTENALWSLTIALILAAVVAVIFIRIFKHRGVWNKFILREELTEEAGFVSQESKSYLVGMSGTAVTPLRPAGTAMIDGKRIDVVTQGEFIAAGRPIEVIQVEGARVIVCEQQSKG
jgi:membrane-bound serine protease (ClpP class)